MKIRPLLLLIALLPTPGCGEGDQSGSRPFPDQAPLDSAEQPQPALDAPALNPQQPPANSAQPLPNPFGLDAAGSAQVPAQGDDDQGGNDPPPVSRDSCAFALDACLGCEDYEACVACMEGASLDPALICEL